MSTERIIILKQTLADLIEQRDAINEEIARLAVEIESIENTAEDLYL
jgi:prefoldin subunit 5